MLTIIKTNIIFDVVPLSGPMLCLLLLMGKEHCTAVSCHAVHKWLGTGTTMGNRRGGILTRSLALAWAPPENHLPLLVLVFSSANTFSTHLTMKCLFLLRATRRLAWTSSGDSLPKKAEVHPPAFEKVSTSLKSSMTTYWRKPKTFPGKSQPGSSKIKAGSSGVRATPLPLQYFICCDLHGHRAEGLGDHT